MMDTFVFIVILKDIYSKSICRWKTPITALQKVPGASLNSKDDEIECIKNNSCEKASNANDLLSKKFEPLRSPLIQYIGEKNKKHEQQSATVHLQQFFIHYNKSQNNLLHLSDESEQSKLLLNREIKSHRQLQIKFEDLNTTY